MSSGFNCCSTKLKPVSVPNATAKKDTTIQSEIEDPRVQRHRAHLLVDILIIGILAVIAGGKVGGHGKPY